MMRRAWDQAAHELRLHAGLAVGLVRWTLLGCASGLLAGLSCFVFLDVLERVTEYRIEHEWLPWLLPVAGLAVGFGYHVLGGRAARGNELLLDEIHEPTEWIPHRMAPLILVGTWLTHLFGGSAGREGTALQLSGSLTDTLSRALRLSDADRRILLIASLGGGFGAVFGVPLAGAVFALEVQAVGRIRYEALVPALAASVVGDLVVEALGYEHTVRTQLAPDLDASLLLRVALAGVAFGLVGAVFAAVTHGIRSLLARAIAPVWLRPAVGGVALVGLMLLFGRDYLGLSLPLVDSALGGEAMGFEVFALKLVFTAVTLGCGFPGGEVTPLFVIGGTLGAALAGPLDLPVPVLAAIGFVAIFAGAANTPLACTIMGVELFGSGLVVPLAAGCVVAYVFSSHRGIYASQRVDLAKSGRPVEGAPSLRGWAERIRKRQGS